RIGVRVPLLVGPALTTVALLLLTQLEPNSSYVDILGPMLLMALGMGCVFVPLTLTAVSGVRREESGLASAPLNTRQQVRGAIGLAALATVAASAAKDRAAELAVTHGGKLTPELQAVATTHGYSRAFLAGAGLAFLGLVVSAVAIRVPRESVQQQAEAAPAV